MHPCSEKASSTLGGISKAVAIRLMEIILPAYSALFKPHIQSAACSFGVTSMREILTNWREFRGAGAIEMVRELECMMCKERLQEHRQCPTI